MMKREDLKDNRLLIIRVLNKLYSDINKRLQALGLFNNKIHFEIYNDIWFSLTEPTNIKMYNIDSMISLLDAINIRLTQLEMLNDCFYSIFVERLNKIKLLVTQQNNEHK